MEKIFKIWTYEEGEKPLFHSGPMNLIYGIEGHFMDELESKKCPFAARRPDDAMLFFIPVSVVNIIRFVYRPYTSDASYSRDRLQGLVSDYIQVISRKYPFWNQSSGADHFMVSCHDWVCHSFLSIIYPFVFGIGLNFYATFHDGVCHPWVSILSTKLISSLNLRRCCSLVCPDLHMFRQEY